MKKFLVLVLPVFIFLLAGQVFAADEMVFDSTDNYLGACQLTDKSEWELEQNLNVTTFQVWYNWSQGETTLPVTVYRDGKEFAKFNATRGNCDPYQQQWCNADYAVNKNFPAGKYSTVIPNARQCLKPGGTGAIRLYGAAGVAAANNSESSSKSCVGSNIVFAVIGLFVGFAASHFIPKKKQ